MILVVFIIGLVVGFAIGAPFGWRANSDARAAAAHAGVEKNRQDERRRAGWAWFKWDWALAALFVLTVLAIWNAL